MKEQLSESNKEVENRQIDVIFTNEQENIEEKYKLLIEEKESLLIKEDAIKNQIGDYQIKINELFQNNETNGQYYVNNEKSKEKYLNNCFELDKNSKDISINKNDQNEMNILYKEVTLLHPRKLINGEIKKYSFCSWTGCFTCQKCPKLEKNEFFPLGFGISSYFKTLKLFIFFFFIISCINLIAAYNYSKYTSLIKYDSFLFKTTLGNTKIATYNTKLHSFKYKEYKDIELNCYNKTIGKFIYGLSHNDLFETDYPIDLNNQNEITFPDTLENKNDWSYLNKDILKYYNEKINECHNKTECNFQIDENFFDLNDRLFEFPHHNHILYYECIDNSLIPNNSKQFSLITITQESAAFTLILLIILYYFYRGAIEDDNNNYHKDKIIINNYTLVLHDLKYNTKDFYKELNDLISHLNNLISSEMKSYDKDFAFEQDSNYFKNNEFNDYNNLVKYKNMNVFDISISTVNEKKMAIIEKIKSLKNDITDLKEGNDTLEKKLRSKIMNAVGTVTSLFNQIKNKNKDNDNDNDNDDKKDEVLMDATDENITEDRLKKIDKAKNKIKKQMTKMSKNQIQGLHMESDKKKYVDIYITFRNPLISNFIYTSYKKNFFQRVLLFLCCKIKTIKLFYYKRQWLNFDMSNNAPTNIKWENCYVSTKKKYCRRGISIIISFFIIILSTAIFYYLTIKKNIANSKINSYIITGIIQVISIVSETILEKLTNSEKYSTLSKHISADIEKYFFLNFIISSFSVNIAALFTYNNFTEQYPILITSILSSMMLSIFTAHASTLAKYLFNLLKRYLDSNFESGKTTKLNKKLEYEELYIGPDFPIGARLSKIYLNLGITFLYGASCPIIYLFFTLFLVSTFIVDKFLIIHYYKKPPYYDNYFTVLTKKILFLSIILYIYGTIYHICNPYLFNYFQSDSIDFGFIFWDIYLIFNPFSIFFRIYGQFISHLPILIYNSSELSYPYIILMCFLIFPLIYMNICGSRKKKEKQSLQNAPNIDIGLIYSLDELNKYYEIKKLELFKLLMNFDQKKEIKEYSKLADNLKNVVDYLKQNIEYKKKINNKAQENSDNGQNNIIAQNNIIETNTGDSNKLIVRENNKKNSDRLLLGDPSYNLAFISNYEIFEHYDLLYYD